MDQSHPNNGLPGYHSVARPSDEAFGSAGRASFPSSYILNESDMNLFPGEGFDLVKDQFPGPPDIFPAAFDSYKGRPPRKYSEGVSGDSGYRSRSHTPIGQYAFDLYQDDSFFDFESEYPKYSLSLRPPQQLPSIHELLSSSSRNYSIPKLNQQSEPYQLREAEAETSPPKLTPNKAKRRPTTVEEFNHDCRVCGELVKGTSNWKSHMLKHDTERKYPFKCTAILGRSSCNKKFQRKTDLDKHYDKVHVKARPHMCTHCGNSYARIDTIRRHDAVGCPARSQHENLAKTETRQGRVSGERTPDGNRKRLPAVSHDGVSATKPGNTDYHQTYPDPALTMTPVTISQETPANTTCSPFDEKPHSLPLASPENCSTQQPHNENHDQLRLQPTRRMASVDILQRSPATSIDSPSPETTSSNETSLCTDSDESSGFLDDNDTQLVVLHSKHMLLVDLMQEVYAIFDQRWDAKIQAHAGSSPTNTPPSSQDRTSASSRKGKKRCRDDRDFTPPDEGQRRKRPSSEFSSNPEKQNDPFACPFHKHEPDYNHECPAPTRERSPQSRSFADFEAYSRTELPRLVEANLQVIVSSEMAPLEESLRAMLVDIVRRCQSTVVQNYGRIHSPPAGEIAGTEQSSSDPTETLFPAFQSTGPQGSEPLLLPTIPNISTQDSTLSSQETSTTFRRNDLHPEGMRDFYEEPPLGNTDPVDNSLDMGSYALENPPSDSGYGSFLFFCECPNGLDYRVGKSPIHQLMQEHHLTRSVENDKGICSSCGLEGDYFGNEHTEMPNFGS
ncbi:MAG: hypothetical protein Q9195_006075 [Heterodermia aff. obscurata]